MLGFESGSKIFMHSRIGSIPALFGIGDFECLDDGIQIYNLHLACTFPKWEDQHQGIIFYDGPRQGLDSLIANGLSPEHRWVELKSASKLSKSGIVHVHVGCGLPTERKNPEIMHTCASQYHLYMIQYKLLVY